MPSPPSERGGDPEIVRESQRRRFDDASLVDEVVRLDEEWRSVHYQLEQLNRKLNTLSKQVASLHKSKPGSGETKPGSTESILIESRRVKAEISSLEQVEAEALRVRDKVLSLKTP